MRSLAVSSLFVAGILFGGQQANAQEQKIAFVDLQRVLNDVAEGAAARSKLKKEFDQKQAVLDKKQKELKKMKEELESQGMMMKPEIKQQRVQELQRNLMQVQQTYMEMQQELSGKEAEMTSKIFKKMGVIVEAIGKEKGYTLIADRNAILFAQNQLDLTAEVIRRYNAAYDASGNAK